MKTVNIAITAASFSGNKGAAAMLQSSIKQLRERYGKELCVTLMSTYPKEDKKIIKAMPEHYDFINVVDARPEKLLFIAFPLALLYSFMRFVPLLSRLFRKNAIIRAYSNTNLVIDEAGVSFVDGRGVIMNIYAFVCAAVPMLCGAPVVKYSQAIGTFRSPINRFLARLVLPRLKLICARGESTRKNLADIKIIDNVKLCADGAFTMADEKCYVDLVDTLYGGDSFYNGNVAAVSLSSVVDKKCRKSGIDYKGCMTQFIDRLCDKGYNVLIIANAARENSLKPRNNDLILCSSVYNSCQNKDKIRWYEREMYPEEIRLLISKCVCLVGSRFHAMIGALEKCVPVLLIGWSHKYKEVLDMFSLGEYAVDYYELSSDRLCDSFDLFMDKSEEIRNKISDALPSVKESSMDNIRYICGIINALMAENK